MPLVDSKGEALVSVDLSLDTEGNANECLPIGGWEVLGNVT